MTRVRMFVTTALLLGLAATPSMAEAETAQVVYASSGSYAEGQAPSIQLSDGTTRDFAALFVVPGGTIVGSGPVGSADMTKPWGALHMYIVAGPGGGFGRTAACTVFQNPTSWSPATDGPLVHMPMGPERTVGGMQFTATCPDDPTYESYTMRWDAAFLGGHTSTVFQHPRPSLMYETWSPAPPLAANGALASLTRSSESATVSVCAVRRQDGGRECHKGYEGMGRIYPSVTDLTATSYAL